MLNYLLFFAVIFLVIRLMILLKNQKQANSLKKDSVNNDDVLDDVKRILNSEED